MQQFSFKRSAVPATGGGVVVPSFTGQGFYNSYKDADFVRVQENVDMILSEGHQLHKKVSALLPGTTLEITGMNISAGNPLILRKGGPGVTIQDSEFTLNRLTGFVAAYVYDHREFFTNIDIPVANGLGLTWNNQDAESAKLYLSAVFGSEHLLLLAHSWHIHIVSMEMTVNNKIKYHHMFQTCFNFYNKYILEIQ